MIVAPVAAFWVFAVLATTSPDEVMPLLQGLVAEPHSLSTPSVVVTNIIFLIGILAFVFTLIAMPARSSSCYTQAVHRLLREHCNTPANGYVRVLEASLKESAALPAAPTSA